MQVHQTTPPRFPLGVPVRATSATVGIRGRLLGRFEHWVWKLEQRGIERYLASSQDVFELESRIRHLHRAGGQPY